MPRNRVGQDPHCQGDSGWNDDGLMTVTGKPWTQQGARVLSRPRSAAGRALGRAGWPIRQRSSMRRILRLRALLAGRKPAGGRARCTSGRDPACELCKHPLSGCRTPQYPDGQKTPPVPLRKARHGRQVRGGTCARWISAQRSVAVRLSDPAHASGAVRRTRPGLGRLAAVEKEIREIEQLQEDWRCGWGAGISDEPGGVRPGQRHP